MSSPNMNLQVPDVGVTVGPDYAEQVNESLDTIDTHDHSPGKGVLVPVAGMNFNDTVNLHGNEIQSLKSAQLDAQPSTLVSTADLRKFYVVGNDLFFTDGTGVAVRITQNGAVTAPASVGLPSGTMVAYGGTTAPSGWLACDGSAVDRLTFADLFAAIGTNYGVGDGSTTFNLPDKRGRTSVGAGTYVDPVSGTVSRSQGTKLGAEKHVLTVNELASHTHVQDAHTHVQNPHTHTGTVRVVANAGVDPNSIQSGTGNGVGPTLVNAVNTNSVTATNQNTTAVNQNTGSNVAHNNMQPSEVDLWIIKI